MKNYFAPELETLKFTQTDVICASSVQDDKVTEGINPEHDADIASV